MHLLAGELFHSKKNEIPGGSQRWMVERQPLLAATQSTQGRAEAPTLDGEFDMFRPALTDGAKIWELVKGSQSLELNTAYAYLLLASHFRSTTVIACEKQRVVGFVAGYRLPEASHVLFVWQVGVATEARGKGVASALVDTLVLNTPDIKFIEATVAPSNKASLALFSSFAKRWRTQMKCRPMFLAEHFPMSPTASGATAVTAHEAEPAWRIGPLSISAEK